VVAPAVDTAAAVVEPAGSAVAPDALPLVADEADTVALPLVEPLGAVAGAAAEPARSPRPAPDAPAPVAAAPADAVRADAVRADAVRADAVTAGAAPLVEELPTAPLSVVAPPARSAPVSDTRAGGTDTDRAPGADRGKDADRAPDADDATAADDDTPARPDREPAGGPVDAATGAVGGLLGG
jgi:hypothetical protein